MKPCLLDKLQPGRLLKVWLITILACYQLNAQVFPLKAEKETRLLITKTGQPFYLSACSYKLVSQSAEDFNYLLNRWGNLGINTLFVKITQESATDRNRDPFTRFKKKVNQLKRVTRDARLNNMAVLIYPENIVKSDSGLVYFSILAKKLSNYNNVLWAFDTTDFRAASTINTHQLKATFKKGDSTSNGALRPDFLISQDSIRTIGSGLPNIVLYRTSPQPRDSSLFNFRKALYGGFLKRATGIILLHEQDKNFTAANPFLYQVRLFRNLIDTLPWSDFKRYPAIFSAGTSQQISAFAAINTHSPQVILYCFPPKTLPLNLTTFRSNLTFSWIQPSTGKVFNSHILPRPAEQLFMPPEVDSYDWLLVISPQK